MPRLAADTLADAVAMPHSLLTAVYAGRHDAAGRKHIAGPPRYYEMAGGFSR